MKLYEQLEDSIISDIIRRIMKTGLVTATAQHQIEQLQEMGLLYDDILALIAQQTDATTQHVKALFEDAGIESVQIDNEIYRENDLTPVDIRQSPAMRQTLEAGYRKTLGNMKNLTLTTAITSQTAYMNACNQAYMQVSSGAFSYQEAIKQAVKKVAETGAMVLYPSGHQERADVAIRRSVLTGIGQTCREIGKMNAEESGCDLMEITAHSGARPEHAKWQGQLVSLSGKNAGRTINGKKVLSLQQVGYGTGDGIFGWNCRHDWFPFFEGYSKPIYSKSDLEKLDEKNIEYDGKMYSEYEISQMQRAKERKVRALKRQVIASQTALENAPDDVTKAELQTDYSENAVKLKSAEKQLKEFCKQTGRRNDTFRTRVDGFGRSQAQKAVFENKKVQKNLTFSDNNAIMNKKKSFRIPISDETIRNVEFVQPDGFSYEDAVALQEAHRSLLAEARKYPLGTECCILLDVMNMEQIGDIEIGKIDSVLPPECDEFHVVLHNHSSGATFSVGDIVRFVNVDTMQMMTAIGHNSKVYCLLKTVAFDAEKCLDYIQNKLDEKIFKGKNFRELTKEFASTLTENEVKELKKVLVQFSNDILDEVVTYGAIYYE